MKFHTESLPVPGVQRKEAGPSLFHRLGGWDLLFWILVVFYLLGAAPLIFKAVGDVRQLAAFSPVSTDEAKLVKMSMLNLEQGSFGAHQWYVYGGFFFILQLALIYPLSLFVPLGEPTVLILSRLTSLIFGALSMWALYCLARKLFDKPTALLSVVVMVSSWVFFFWSVADHPDLPQAFFVVLALLGCFRVLQTDRVKWLLFAALCASLALSIKYVGVFLLPIIWLSDGIRLLREAHLSHLWHWKKIALRFLGRSLLAAVVFPLVFFTTTPYALLHFRGFLDMLRFNTEVVTSGITFGVDVPGTVWLELIASRQVLGIALSLFALGYLVVFLLRYVRHISAQAPRSDAVLVIVAWVVLFLAYVYWWIDYHPPHYLLPVMPFLCLLAGRGLVELLSVRTRRRLVRSISTMLAGGLLLFALIDRGQPLVAFWQERMDFSLTTHPVIRAGLWLQEAFPADIRVNYDASYTYIPQYFKNAQIEFSVDADVIVINRASAGTFDAPGLADGSAMGREAYMTRYNFYRTLLDAERRPPHLVMVRDFGAVIVYLNVEHFLDGEVRAPSHNGAASVVFPARADGRDAVFAFSPSEGEEAVEFEQRWGDYATREEIRGLNGELLTVLFRVKNVDLPAVNAPFGLFDHGAFPLRPERRTYRRFVQGPEFLGYRIVNAEVTPDEPLLVDLFWHAAQTMHEDYTVFVHAVDAFGRTQGTGDKRPLDGLYPTDLWKPGDVIVDRFAVPFFPCAPTGLYSLEVGLYRLSDGQRLPLLDSVGATAVSLGPFDVAIAGAVPIADLSPTRTIDSALSDAPVSLLGFDQEREAVSPGQPFNLVLYWSATGHVSVIPSIEVTLHGEDGVSRLLWQGEIGSGRMGGIPWLPGRGVCHTLDMNLPMDIPSGRRALLVRSGEWWTELGELNVVPRKGTFELPHPEVPAEVSFGGRVRCLGHDLVLDSVAAGQSFDVVLYWQAQRQMRENYKVFVHLVDEKGGIIAQHDGVPMGGEYPTTLWASYEIVRDVHTLSVPDSAVVGDYRLLVGLYEARTGRRLIPLGSDDTAWLVRRVKVHPQRP